MVDSVKVSPTTVSLVLNNRGRIRDGTRHRVRAAAKTLGYRPRRALKMSDKEATRYQIAIVYPATLRYPDGTIGAPQSLFLSGIHQELKVYDQFLESVVTLPGLWVVVVAGSVEQVGGLASRFSRSITLTCPTRCGQ